VSDRSTRSISAGVNQPETGPNVGLEKEIAVTAENYVKPIGLIDSFKEAGSVKVSALRFGYRLVHLVRGDRRLPASDSFARDGHSGCTGCSIGESGSRPCTVNIEAAIARTVVATACMAPASAVAPAAATTAATARTGGAATATGSRRRNGAC
jgi:hypothetical protein